MEALFKPAPLSASPGAPGRAPARAPCLISKGHPTVRAIQTDASEPGNLEVYSLGAQLGDGTNSFATY